MFQQEVRREQGKFAAQSGQEWLEVGELGGELGQGAPQVPSESGLYLGHWKPLKTDQQGRDEFIRAFQGHMWTLGLEGRSTRVTVMMAAGAIVSEATRDQ